MRAEGVDLARLAAGLGAALGGGDASAAANTGGTAAEENAFWIPLIMIVGALWTAYDAVTTYRDEGGEAVLKQLAVDGAITLATAGAGKVVYKVGGKVFRFGPKAWQAVKKAGLWRKNVTKTSKKINVNKVNFGRNPNQKYHTWRHIDDIGMDRKTVQNAVLDDIPADLPTGPHKRTITVDNIKIEYRVFKFDDGTYNVGTIFDK